MNQQITGAIVIIVILAIIGTTYTIVTGYKDQELGEMKAQYGKQIDDLTRQLSKYQEDEKSKFVGFWNLSVPTTNASVEFFSDGTCLVYSDRFIVLHSYYSSNSWDYSWYIEDGKLFLTSDFWGNETYYYCFYDNDTTLVLTHTTSLFLDLLASGVYTKQTATPNIQFTIPYYRALEVISVDPVGIVWSNINITVLDGNYENIIWLASKMWHGARSYGNGSSCPTNWGMIEVGNYIRFPNNNATVIMTWIPTNTVIGIWNFSAIPRIEFAKYDRGMLEVTSVSQTDLMWNSINITISSDNYTSIYLYQHIFSSMRSPYGNGSSCPSTWGVIEEGHAIGHPTNVTITLTWMPTNTIIGAWDFT
jgi:hypothetical protein